jgi:protein-L-isoaspartate(D-aspartate) O-methyltransferase
VIGLESDSELAATARDNLQRAGVSNVDVRVANGNQGAAGDAPFDAIVLGGSVAEVPQALLQQLKVGGRLLAIVGQDPVMCATLYTRTGDVAWSSKALWDTTAPRLQGFTEPSRFQF